MVTDAKKVQSENHCITLKIFLDFSCLDRILYMEERW